MKAIVTKYHHWRITRIEASLEKLEAKMTLRARAMSKAESDLMAKGNRLEAGYCDGGTVSTTAYKGGTAKIKKSLDKLDRRFAKMRGHYNRKVKDLRSAIDKHREALMALDR